MNDILIVEDSSTQADEIKFMLEGYQFSSTVAQNGLEALDWLSVNRPLLVISDIVMPKMNGFELCKKIKSDKNLKDIPVVLLTALSDPDEVTEGLLCGADSFITKPYNKKFLLYTIEEILYEKKCVDDISDKNGIEIKYKGKKRVIRTAPQKVVKLLLNVYRGAIFKNDELIQSRNELRQVNEKLEELVDARTNDLQIIESKNELINNSIQYAHKIQSAVLKTPQNGSDFFEEMFCLHLPKDTVSGDFFWFHKTDNKLLVAVFDCTGHGVPGAFMSMLGVTLLIEIVISEKILEPHLILNRLREKVISALGQKGIHFEVNDGMDGSVIIYDITTEILSYAGAFNPLYIIRNNEMIELKGNNMPLSYEDKMSDFTHYEMKMSPKDLIYMFTDGYTDQFGGPLSKKFSRKRFKEILLKNQKRTLEWQKQLLLDAHIIWKGYEDQVDDITVVGLKIK
jgi:serine phosphatase RsbU (regulator of sigma subunit)